MAKEKHNHFIPSPFPTVTQYENAFINSWKKNTAKAVAEVLKYMAQATAFAMKNNSVEDILDLNKSFETDIEKAKWQIGEIRVNSRGIAHECFEYVNGKPHLRRVKKQKKPQHTQEIWELNDLFKGKTQKECQDFLIEKRIFHKDTDILNADADTVRSISSAIYNLYQKIPFSPVKVTMATLKNATMDASLGKEIRLNKKFFLDFDPQRYYNDTHTRYLNRIKYNIDALKNVIQSKLKANPNADVSFLEKSIKKYKDMYSKFPCWTFGEKDSMAADIFLHEMGHILNGQCTGGCKSFNMLWYQKRDAKTISEEKQWNLKRGVIFKRYKKENRVISEYSTTKEAEFFAECFVAWIHKDPMLPDYVRDFYDDYFKHNKARR